MTKASNAGAISRFNVGRIAERIVANELEARGFRVSDLNSDGLSANADLLAAGHKRIWQIQVKGATNTEKERWWVQYGHCTDTIIEGRAPMFNRRESFYKADIVILVAVRSPARYCCIVLPIKSAERAAQLNLKRYYRTPKRDGSKKKPGKVWITLERGPRDRVRHKLLDKERSILDQHKDAWAILQLP